MDLATAHQQGWFKALPYAKREELLFTYYTDPARAKKGLYKTKMCVKHPKGNCKRGNHNAKPQASGVR